MRARVGDGSAVQVLRPTAVGAVTSLDDIGKQGKTVCAAKAVSNMITVPGIAVSRPPLPPLPTSYTNCTSSRLRTAPVERTATM